MPHLIRLLPILATLALLWTVVLPAGAWAHAELVAASPADGETVHHAPPTLSLRFNEAVTTLGITLTGTTGPVALPARPVANGTTIAVRLPPFMAPGTYLASWRVVSADGHPVGGTIAFGIGEATASPAPDAPPHLALPWEWAVGAMRFALYAGFAVGAGGALFGWLVAPVPARLRRGMAWAAAGGALAALLSIGLQGALLLAADSPRILLTVEPWAVAAGTSVLWRGAVVAAALSVVAATITRTRRLPAAAAVVAAVGLALSGHAASGGAGTQALLALHALAEAFWLGAFWPLAEILAAEGPGAAPIIDRFSWLAVGAVALLLATGVTQAVLHLGSWASLVGTTHGRLILAKLLGADWLLTLAAVNRLHYTPRLRAVGSGAAGGLRRMIAVEAVVAVLVLGLTSGLTLTAPREHAAPQAPALSAPTAPSLTVTPSKAGWNRVTVTLETAPKEVWVVFANPAAHIDGLRRQMRPDGPGQWVHAGPELAVPGLWTAHIEMLVTDFDLVTLHREFTIQEPNQ